MRRLANPIPSAPNAGEENIEQILLTSFLTGFRHVSALNQYDLVGEWQDANNTTVFLVAIILWLPE
jgi:hypothetical protein